MTATVSASTYKHHIPITIKYGTKLIYTPSGTAAQWYDIELTTERHSLILSQGNAATNQHNLVQAGNVVAIVERMKSLLYHQLLDKTRK